MGALIDLAGRRFGRLTVERRLPDAITPSGARQPVWGCVCACGRLTAEQGRALRAGRALSCRECVRDPSRMLKYGTTYIVWWPTLGILKIGRAFRGSRLEMMRQTGAVVLLDARGTDASWEAAGLRELRRLFDPAFTGPSGEGPHRADRILYRGRGWSECFFVEHEDLQLAYDVCLRAFAREGNDFGDNPPATAGWRRALDAARRARAAHRGRSHRALPACRGGAGGSARAASGTPGSTAVPNRTAPSSDRTTHPAHPDARGSRARAHLGGERPRMACTPRPPRAAHHVPHSPAAPLLRPDTHRPGSARRVAIFNGWGERERERGSASESARASTCTGRRRGPAAPRSVGSLGCRVQPGLTTRPADTPRAVGCSAHRLPGSPQRLDGRVRSLRHGVGQAQGVPRSSPVRRATVDLRGEVGR